jgi:hypothetical protein
MKIQDVLRRVADMMDSEPESMSDQMPNQAKMAAVEVDNEDGTAPDAMVSPLQQQLEIMKKVAGIPNSFDSADEESEEYDDEEACGCGGGDHEEHDDGHENALDALRRMAGITAAR